MEIILFLFILGIFVALLVPEKPPKPYKDEVCKDKQDVIEKLVPKEPLKPKKPEKENPPIKLIAITATSLALLSDFSASQSLLKEISRELLEPESASRSSSTRSENTAKSSQNSSRNSSQNSAVNNNLLSPDVEQRLRQCIQSNIVELSGVPTLSGFLESLSWEREVEGEFEQQIIFLYTRVQQLRDTVEKCDPSLVQEILVAREKEIQNR